MFFVIGALRAVVDRAAARHAIQAGVLAMENLQDAVTVSANRRIVLDDWTVLALNGWKRLRVIYYDVTDWTICYSPR